MPSERELKEAEARRRIAAEKRRRARERHLARLTPEQRANLGKGFAASFGALSEEDGEIFEKALWDGRRL
jgi:Spy/CpxP family protein refolding chaperone